MPFAPPIRQEAAGKTWIPRTSLCAACACSTRKAVCSTLTGSWMVAHSPASSDPTKLIRAHAGPAVAGDTWASVPPSSSVGSMRLGPSS
jgi:hypothetical protein